MTGTLALDRDLVATPSPASLRADLVVALERVVAMRERRRVLAAEQWLGSLLEPTISIMTAAIETAKVALADDPIGLDAALRGLARFDDAS